jgi:hypothetical protein
LAGVHAPHLVRRRELWVPTALGWAVLAALLLAGARLVLPGLYSFLAPDRPLGHGVLVVEGWISEPAFDEALQTWRAGDYVKIVTTGGFIKRGACPESFRTYAEYAARALEARGVPAESIAVVSTPDSARDRTYLSAVMVREWIGRSGLPVRALDVFSEGAHARRTWRLYRKAFGDDLAVGIRAAAPEYDPGAWWRESSGAKDVLTEAIAWGWAACCFHPGPRGSLDEKWGAP